MLLVLYLNFLWYLLVTSAARTTHGISLSLSPLSLCLPLCLSLLGYNPGVDSWIPWSQMGSLSPSETLHVSSCPCPRQAALNLFYSVILLQPLWTPEKGCWFSIQWSGHIEQKKVKWRCKLDALFLFFCALLTLLKVKLSARVEPPAQDPHRASNWWQDKNCHHTCAQSYFLLSLSQPHKGNWNKHLITVLSFFFLITSSCSVL